MRIDIDGLGVLGAIVRPEDAKVGGGSGGNTSDTGTATQAPSGSGEEAASGGGSGLWGILPMLLFYAALIFVMYLVMFRPQRKRDKKAAEMRDALRVGDNVLTSGGFYGKIVELGTDAHIIEFGTNRGIRVPVRKTDILGVSEPTLTPPISKS